MTKHEATEQAYKKGYDDGKPKWIPVTERLPEDGSDVLAYRWDGIEGRIFPANYYKDWWEDCILNERCLHVTHWMPLPEPPKEDGHA